MPDRRIEGDAVGDEEGDAAARGGLGKPLYSREPKIELYDDTDIRG